MDGAYRHPAGLTGIPRHLTARPDDIGVYLVNLAIIDLASKDADRARDVLSVRWKMWARCGSLTNGRPMRSMVGFALISPFKNAHRHRCT
jgi:hypothetical protein